MTTVSIPDEVRSLVANMARSYENIKWVICPVCREEWTKLMPVVFYPVDSDGKTVRRVVHTCPPCSHSVRSCQWFAEHYGITFDSSAEIRRLPAYANLPSSHLIDSGLYVRLCDGTRILPRGERVEVYREGEEKRSFDNTPAAMVFLATGETKTKEEPTWTV